MSLYTLVEQVEEDPALVTHIRHLFLELKDPLADHASNLIRCDIKSPLDQVMIFLMQIWFHICLEFLLCSCRIERTEVLWFSYRRRPQMYS